MKSMCLTVVALTVLGMSVNLASAQSVVPEVIPYTGYLEMPEPQPREVHLRVELWNQLNGGEVHYCEEHAQVGLYQKRFAINIGQGNACPVPRVRKRRDSVLNSSVNVPDFYISKCAPSRRCLDHRRSTPAVLNSALRGKGGHNGIHRHHPRVRRPGGPDPKWLPPV